MDLVVFKQNMELASTSSLPKVVETLGFFFLLTVFYVLQHGILKSLSCRLSDEMHQLPTHEDYYCLGYFLEKARTGNG